jgi:hypothetical protein
MERRRRTQLQRLNGLVGVLFCAGGCSAVGVQPEPAAQLQAAPMLPNEKDHAVRPCEQHALAPGRVMLEVAIDDAGAPLDARVTSLGGTVRHAFVNCVRTNLLAQEYAPRGEQTTIGAVVDLRVGAFSSAGSPTPIPQDY